MSKRFEFRDNRLKLDIAGNIFEIDTTDLELIKELQTFSVEAHKKAEELSKKDDYINALAEAIQFCLDYIDKILGDGASKKIFANRKVNFLDCLDVINFIVSEVNEFRIEKFQQYSPNRAMRRASKK